MMMQGKGPWIVLAIMLVGMAKYLPSSQVDSTQRFAVAENTFFKNATGFSVTLAVLNDAESKISARELEAEFQREGLTRVAGFSYTPTCLVGVEKQDFTIVCKHENVNTNTPLSTHTQSAPDALVFIRKFIVLISQYTRV